MTVVGTGEVNFIPGKRRENTSRNCSRRVDTCFISFSLALPTREKLFERTLIHVSFAATERLAGTTVRKQRVVTTIRRYSFTRTWEGLTGRFRCTVSSGGIDMRPCGPTRTIQTLFYT